MVEEFRKGNVQYYDGWLIVRVVDHRSAGTSASGSGSVADDEKLYSIHKYTPYITPSPYAPYPAKEQSTTKSPKIKHEHRISISSQATIALNSDLPSEGNVEAVQKSNKPGPKVYHVALRPTILSRHMDVVIDSMTPDPKAKGKQSQAQLNSRTQASAAPGTPVGGVPSTPGTEKGLPNKKQKMKVEEKDLLAYEAGIINATAPPLFLEPVDSLEEAEAVIAMLKDPLHDEEPSSPRSRKRTVAELAADDAHAKEQERFMLVMDERGIAGTTATNATAVDAQAGGAMFQPRFEKFNALENIKRDIAERKQREKDRQLQEDEHRRGQQEKAEEEKRRAQQKMLMVQQQQQQRKNVELIQQHRQQQELQARMAQQQAMQGQQSQPNGIPPNMQARMMGQVGSPVVRQGTPHAASSPVVNNMAQGGQSMTVSSSQQGHGSPPRPGSAVQHAHPGAPMVRAPSGQGAPSRNGTPQIPHSTPGMRTATPVMRQGTPSQNMNAGSPQGSMTVPTPQMGHAGMMNGSQMPNGMATARQPNAAQLAEMQRRAHLQQQAAQMGSQMPNGTPQMNQAQMAHIQAQQHANIDRQNALRAQHLQHQHQLNQQQGGTPHAQQGQSPAQSTASYKQQVAEQMKAQMQNLSQGGHPQHQPSPTPNPNHMTPQVQAAQMAQLQQATMMRQAQQQAAMSNSQQQQQQPRALPPALRQYQQTAYQQFKMKKTQETAMSNYGGNFQAIPPHEQMQIDQAAKQYAFNQTRLKQQQMMQQNAIRQQQVQAQAQAQAQMMAGQNGMMANANGMAQQSAGMNGGNMNVNMMQQAQAQQMQQMQMAAAAQHMQNQGTMGNATHQYQQQLAQMMAEQKRAQGNAGWEG